MFSLARKNKIKLPKLYVILIVILVILLSLFFYVKVKNIDGVGVVQGVKNSIFTKDCVVTDTIEYVYYEDKKDNWDNNKFGIYVYAENKDFFELAQQLVNSNGGDWGYVLIPYNVKDRDYDKWGRVFEQLNNKHLIPVIQLWDIDVNDYKKQTKESAKFLNSFVWPIRERYISAYNEVNDANFWYGYVNPEEYAKILNYTIDTYKKENPEFFIMNGALNVSAEDNTISMDAFKYMNRMNKEVPGIFNRLDGWASHSYPQPNFTGSPYSTGRFSIKAYDTELNYLKNELKVEKNLPVFITETGWAHAEGKNYNYTYLPVNKVAEFTKIAFEKIWLKDDRVKAVMPFTIKYDAPFDHFSWVNEDKVPYAHYDEIKAMPKTKGNPPKLVTEKFEVKTCE